MAGSLFDQLKKSGLVDDKKAKQIKKQKYQQAKQKKGKKGQPVVSEATKLAEQAAQEKQARDRQLNLERQQAQEKKAAQAAVQQRIESNRLTNYKGNMAYQFVDGSTIKTLHVSQKIHQQLVSGEVRIALFEEGYALVELAVAERIEQVDASLLIPMPTTQDDTLSEEDKDYYAQFEIPDDLVW
ncbi:hypothetical protein; putative nucleoprotein/polynucleotide-associated enzyme [hydrothermal vent metagenome]|uniref:Nucleoprotein/polynucleotide-associated enzyme n=1 Tax=hydrothermal vent metagenome TaxID=652676 RepID=A0A3B0W5J5_9ZZZZ